MPGPRTQRPLRVAVLLSAESFEHFFRDQLGYDRARYVSHYRNDWAWDYCKALRDAGMFALLYVASHEETGRDETPDGHAVRFLPLGRGYAPWRRLPVLKRSPAGRYIAQVVNGRALWDPLTAALRDDRVDVLAIQEYWTGRFDLLAHRIGRLPLLAIDQGLPDRHEVKALKRRTLPRPHAIVTQTEEEAGKVRRYGGRALRLPNGVDSTYFSPSLKPDQRDRRLLIAARLHDFQKRISDLIEAFSLLDGSWRLDVAGDGPDGAQLRRLAGQRGVADRVTFHGFMDRAPLREHYRSCGVFALPSAYEGLPVALLEAMACGAATVGSAIPAIAEVVTDGVDGRLVPVGDPAALAAAIEDGYARRKALGDAARATIERDYSQEAFAARIAALVRAAVADAQGPRL